jgi:DNA mismatch endonuclease, patch repair protein
VDTLSSDERSERMSRVRNKDTKPEWAVRRLVHGLGFRYRLHARNLPGRPDLVFRPRQKVIFVHGCFWHRHSGCPNCRMPKSRLDFWKPKLRANRVRDLKNERALKKLGWEFLVVWECEVKDTDALSRRLREFLKPE